MEAVSAETLKDIIVLEEDLQIHYVRIVLTFDCIRKAFGIDPSWVKKWIDRLFAEVKTFCKFLGTRYDADEILSHLDSMDVSHEYFKIYVEHGMKYNKLSSGCEACHNFMMRLHTLLSTLSEELEIPFKFPFPKLLTL